MKASLKHKLSIFHFISYSLLIWQYLVKYSALPLAVSVSGHEYFPGQCPSFTPMSGFDWDKFSSGLWYVTRKFSTKSSCLTYEFKTDSDGFKSVEQVRQLPYSERVGLDHEYM